jgi:predicted deacylase
VVAGEPGPLPTPQCEGTALNAVDTLVAPTAGCLVYKVKLGDRVRPGELVAEIVNPLAASPAQRRTPLLAATEGILYQRKMLRQVRPGQSCGKIAGRELLPTRHGILLEP